MATQKTSNHREHSGSQSSQPLSRQSPGFEGEASRDWGSLRSEGGQSSGYMSQASDYWERGEGQMRRLVRDREGTAILTAVVTGIGIGLVIGAAIGRSHRHQQTWRDRVNFEGFGRRLSERIETILPEAISDYLGK